MSLAKGCALVLLRRTEEGAELLEEIVVACIADGDFYSFGTIDGMIGVSKSFRETSANGIHLLEEAILKRDTEGYRALRIGIASYLCEVYLQIIAGNEKLPLTDLIEESANTSEGDATAPSRIRALMSSMLENPHFDPEGHHAGRAQMILGLLYKTKKKRALAVQHLTEAKRILSQFGQTPILARVETALAELGQ